MDFLSVNRECVLVAELCVACMFKQIFFWYHNFWHIIYVIKTERDLFMQHTQNYRQFARARAKVKERHITIYEDGRQQIGILNKAKIIGRYAWSVLWSLAINSSRLELWLLPSFEYLRHNRIGRHKTNFCLISNYFFSLFSFVGGFWFRFEIQDPKRTHPAIKNLFLWVYVGYVILLSFHFEICFC